MGALLAIPEILAAWDVAGLEAIELSGGLGSLIAGGGLEALENLQTAALLSGLGGLEPTAEAIYLLGAVPAAVQQAQAVQAGLSLAFLLSSTVLLSHQPGQHVLHPHRLSGRLGPEAMALQLWLPQLPVDIGIDRIPEWLYAAAQELPEVLASILRDIARGIWRSYYNTGRALIRSTAREQLESALSMIRRRFQQDIRPILDRAQEDPVGHIIDVFNLVRDFGREREWRQLAEGRPIFDLYGDRDVIVWDANSIPDGYNDQDSGMYFGGRWLSFPGPGAAGEHALPQWILLVLEELQKEVSFLTRKKYVLQKEGQSKRGGKASNPPQKRRRGGPGGHPPN